MKKMFFCLNVLVLTVGSSLFANSDEEICANQKNPKMTDTPR